MSKRGVVITIVSLSLLTATAYAWAYAPKEAPELSSVQVKVSNGTTYTFTVTWSADAGKPREVRIIIGNYDKMLQYSERVTHREIVAESATVVCEAPTEGAPWTLILSNNRGTDSESSEDASL